MRRTDYRELPAPPGLGLACVWTQTVPRDSEPYVQRVVPDACVDLIWSEWDGEIEVAGPDTGPVLADIPPGGRLAGVRFTPGMAAPVLGVSVDAVRDDRVPLREFWGDDAPALAEAMASAADPVSALAGAVAARRRAPAADPADPAAPALLSAFTQRTAADSVAAVAVRLGFSERQLRRRSLAAFGYGPKTLQRILRFQRALSLARGGVPLSDVASAAGYADQAHFAHEVRDLAGTTITELLAQPAAPAATDALVLAG